MRRYSLYLEIRRRRDIKAFLKVLVGPDIFRSHYIIFLQSNMGLDVAHDNIDRPYDLVITQIVEYAYEFTVDNSVAWERAKLALLDAIGAAFESIHCSRECARMIEPLFPEDGRAPAGFKVPGTSYQVDILKGAFNLGSMIRYLDHNDAFPGAEWGHPSGMHTLIRCLGQSKLISFVTER